MNLGSLGWWVCGQWVGGWWVGWSVSKWLAIGWSVVIGLMVRGSIGQWPTEKGNKERL